MICYHCFTEYETGNVCPKCGHVNGTERLEPQYMAPGTVLADRYLIGEVVGAGGFGITYAAWDRTLEKKVAVKEYLPGEFSTRMPGNTEISIYGGEKTEQFEAGLSKYYDESKRLAMMRGEPGIVQIFDQIKTNGTAYIVMEFLEGETLAERIRREKRIPLKDANEIFSQILTTLTKVHEKGIIHRDIAPSNIFLCTNGEVKLLDFGAARNASGTHSKSLTVLYKEGFTPAEQYQSHGNQGPWTDVYATAASYYKAITGVTPEGALERSRKDTLKAPGKMGVRVPSNIDCAIMNALNVDVKRRTKTAEEFLQQLQSSQVKNNFVRAQEHKTAEMPRWVIALFGGGAAVLGIVLALFMTGAISPDAASWGKAEAKDTIPRFTNMKIDDAEKKAEKLGIKTVRIQEHSDQVLENVVISQMLTADSADSGAAADPGASISSLQDNTVYLHYSAGVSQVSLPAVLLQQQAAAEQLLKTADLKYKTVKDSAHRNYTAGIVISVQDEAQKELQAGTGVGNDKEVTLIVSDPLEYAQKGQATAVPDLTGMTLEEALQALQTAGLYLDPAKQEYGDRPQGTILSQNAAAGTQAAAGSNVEVSVSLGELSIVIPSADALLVGKPADQAKAFLQTLKITAPDGTEKDAALDIQDRQEASPQPAGTLLRLETAAKENGQAAAPVQLGETAVGQGAVIYLVYSTGPAPAPAKENVQKSGSTGTAAKKPAGSSGKTSTGKTSGGSTGGNSAGSSSGGSSAGNSSGGGAAAPKPKPETAAPQPQPAAQPESHSDNLSNVIGLK